MKVPICRFTGLPVELEDVPKYRDEFRRLFDIAERVCKKDQLRMQMKLAKVEKALNKKFPTLSEVDFCNTPEDWKQLMGKYGNILVSANRHTGDLVFVIDDRDSQRY